MVCRLWLEWSNPCLPEVADRLINQHEATGDVCDLQETLLVTPGKRAGRALLHLLAAQCTTRNWLLLPPRIVTPGNIAEVLLPIADRVASSTERQMAWIETLHRAEGESLASLVGSPPETDEVLFWRDLAITITGLQDELAGRRLSFGDVATHAEGVETMFAEVKRWRALESLHVKYLDVLEVHHLTDSHIARECALSRGIDLEKTPNKIVLVAVTELNTFQRAVIEPLADCTTSMIHAPETLRDHFDDLGCLVCESWVDAIIEIDERNLVICDRPSDQSQETLRTIASYGGQYASTEIAIGLGNEKLVKQLQRDAQWAGLSLHAATGTDLAQTAPCRLLQAISDWVNVPRFAHFASLLRHPDFERRLLRSFEQADSKAERGITSWLSLLDRYFTEHLHQELTGAWLGEDETRRDLKAIHDAASDVLSPLSGPPRHLGAWAEPILDVLREVYGELDAKSSASESKSAEACLALRDLLDSLYAAPVDLQPIVSASVAIEYLLLEAVNLMLAGELKAEQIEMLGWLELHLDLAPALIITGVNDGDIPHAVQGDAFLPDSLRSGLGLMSNARRYARDAYLLQAILSSRSRVTLIAGRRAERGEPLVPSRLLLACDPETVRTRIEVFCTEVETVAVSLPVGCPEPGAMSGFVVPQLSQDLELPEKMSVTDFKQYLECPYRYALSRLLKLKTLTDTGQELDPMRFGSLAHDVLEKFGNDTAVRDSDDEREIESYLMTALETIAKDHYGTSPIAPVRVQLARMQQRLMGFARCQARLRSEGWTIHKCELKFTDANELEIPGQSPIRIVGKIDRIDVHEQTGNWRIFDYKTGESGSSPHKVHLGLERVPENLDEIVWKDLQLPLYRFLAQQHGITGDVELAYFILPKQADGVKISAATWTAPQIEHALETARQVVRDIRDRKFEPTEDLKHSYDQFARICQSTTFSSMELQEAITSGDDA
ncbi:MAG: PD-(D/E)XK nuclease family protein [Planctomycetes bacterium]|nr:PD-(D/E)XK nuclease family protein [Planctomycetota bacterium]